MAKKVTDLSENELREILWRANQYSLTVDLPKMAKVVKELISEAKSEGYREGFDECDYENQMND
jgi:hypothetical protein